MKKMICLVATIFMLHMGYSQDTMHHPTDEMHKMQDCIMMKDGKVMVMKDGKNTMLQSDTTLKNGTTVMTNGTVKFKSGKTLMLKEDQCVYMNGKIGMMKMDDKRMDDDMKKDSM